MQFLFSIYLVSRIAADLIEAGADNGRINRVMFETKTKTYARLERLALESMRFYLDERVAIITVTQEMYHLTGSNEQETEGLAPLTRQIEGVEVGITIREKPDGTCKASLRTFESVNAAEIAKLEQALGMNLFEQLGKRLHLTDAGREVQAGAREIFDALDHLEMRLAQLNGLTAGQLRLDIGRQFPGQKQDRPGPSSYAGEIPCLALRNDCPSSTSWGYTPVPPSNWCNSPPAIRQLSWSAMKKKRPAQIASWGY